MSGDRLSLSERITNTVDLGSKLVLLFVALLAANFFLEADVDVISTSFQAFVDQSDVEEQYGKVGQPLPEVVRRTVAEYNGRNERDLQGALNSTRTDHPAAELCRDLRDVVIQVFERANCTAATPTLGGRGRFYERLLLRVNHDTGSLLDVPALRQAIGFMQGSEYLEGRCDVVNSGRATAEGIVVRPSGDAFKLKSGNLAERLSLNPGERQEVRFRTDEFRERDPELDCTVTFNTGKGWVDSGLRNAIGLALVAVFVVASIFLIRGT